MKTLNFEKDFLSDPYTVHKKYFNFNLIKLFAKSAVNSSLKKHEMIYISILLSSGCRASEPLEYRFIQSTEDVTTVSIPILKRKAPSFKKIQIKHQLFDLNGNDYSTHENKLKKHLYYYRCLKKHLNLDARQYRKLFVTWLCYKKLPVSEIRDILGHSNVSVTDRYIVKIEPDYTDLLSL